MPCYLKCVIIFLFFFVLLTTSAQGQNWPPGDLNGDFRVDIIDLQTFTDQWLDPSGCSGLGCADFDGQNGVNMNDIAILAQNWGKKLLLVNEFMASNNNTIEDPEEPEEFPDWIEIYNASDKTIDLGGMYLTDNDNEPTKWRIPDGISVDADDYIIFWADDDDEQGDRHTNFKLGADGDDVFLFADDAITLIDGISFDTQYSDISYGRYPDGGDYWRFMGLPTPGTSNDAGYLGQVADTRFSVDRGFYNSPFQVRLACDTDGATILYTINGQDPVDSNGIEYNDNSPVQITKTTCLRAAAHKAGWLSSNVDTQTYIFLDDIINQPASAPDSNWPSFSVNGQVFDYGMDTDITTDPEYADLMDDALLAIPSISLVTDLDNLVDPDIGIYVNCGDYGQPGWERGEKWERPVSVELINPDGSDGFQINAGLRMRGITSCKDSNPKHAFRLFFSGKYGGDLEYSLFGEEGVDVYENVDLRCAANWSWSMDGHYRHTAVREVFSRDLQRETGQPYTRSRYYHLYLNGVYWGLYQTQERANSNHGQAYFGGDSDDYDVVKSNRSWPRGMECTDGNFAAYKRLWQYCQDGFDTDQKYYEVQGLNTNGSPNPAYERLVDVENIIDFMLTVFYSGDSDSPITNWGYERSPNNFFGLFNRVNPDGFKYFRHDAEHSLGIRDDTYRDRTGPFNHEWLMNFIEDCPVVPWPPQTCIGFNPQTIHQYLIVHPEYKMKFADHVHKFFFNDGPMKVENAQALFASRAGQIDMAIIAESARWGDSKTSTPLTKNDWLSEIGWVLDTYFPIRTDIVLDQLRNKDWYPSTDAPEYKVNDSFQHGGYVQPTDSISIVSSAGDIYYTTDGNDPRLKGGGINPDASVFQGGSTINYTLVSEDDSKKIFVPSSDIGTTWRGDSEPYDDSAWTHGTYIADKTGGVGYERSTSGILYDDYISYDVESEMYGNMASCYIRIEFNVDAEDLAEFDTLTLKVRCDDGFVAFINGVEAESINKPNPFEWDSSCANRSDDTSFAILPINDHISDLDAGTNILAVHAMNQADDSSDFLCSVELVASSTDTQQGDMNITKTTQLKARCLDGSTWSALCDAVFAVGPVVDNLRITEIMYHPLDTNDPNDPDEEYIELQNTGAETININLVRFTNGLDFTFSDVNLAPDEHIIVVKDINAFTTEYGTGYNIAGQYTGSLANDGERIRLEDAVGTTILDFRYRDGWRSNTDGDGYSLTIVNPDNPDPNSWSEKDSWRPSAHIGGSPGWDDSGIIPNPSDVVINEVLAHTDVYPNDWIELHNTTGSSIDITNWYLSDDDANLTKYELPSTIIPAGGYVVFTQDDHFGSAFALSENGEMVCLTSAKDVNEDLTGYRQKEDFGASENGVAFGRYYKESTDNYNFVAMSENMSGLPNAYPKVGPVVISELMYHPEIFWGNWDAEYIELTNISDDAVNLYDVTTNIPWKVTDGVEFTFPPNTTIPPYSCILLVRDLDAFNTEFPGVPPAVQIFEWDSGRLDNDGEKVEISMAGDLDDFGVRQYIRIDRVNYSNGSHPEDFDGVTDPWPTEADGTGKSLERINLELYGNDPNNWDANTPSPGIIPGFEWTLLSYDNFESGWGSYSSGGVDCILYSGGTFAHQGNYAANIRDDSGDASAFWHDDGIDVASPGYIQIKVDFWFYADSMEEGESFNVKFFDGSVWQPIASFVSGTDFVNGDFYPVTLYIDEGVYNFPADMKLKFECVAESNTDDIYIDEIALYAK